jgi:hypothetical protein
VSAWLDIAPCIGLVPAACCPRPRATRRTRTRSGWAAIDTDSGALGERAKRHKRAIDERRSRVGWSVQTTGRPSGTTAPARRHERALRQRAGHPHLRHCDPLERVGLLGLCPTVRPPPGRLIGRCQDSNAQTGTLAQVQGVGVARSGRCSQRGMNKGSAPAPPCRRGVGCRGRHGHHPPGSGRGPTRGIGAPAIDNGEATLNPAVPEAPNLAATSSLLSPLQARDMWLCGDWVGHDLPTLCASVDRWLGQLTVILCVVIGAAPAPGNAEPTPLNMTSVTV